MKYDQQNLFKDGKRNASFKVQQRPDCPAYLSPLCQKSDIGIIIIQQWWGLNHSITLTADQFAKQGLVALVPDIYRTKSADSRQQAQHKMQGLDFVGATIDINSAKNYLIQKGCKKIHIAGFCMGGALTLATIIRFQGFQKAFPFYGIPTGIDKMDITKLNTQIYAYFGKNDQLMGFSDPSSAEKVKQMFDKAGKHFKLSIKEAGHAFMNKDSPNYNKQAAEASFSQMMKIIKQ